MPHSHRTLDKWNWNERHTFLLHVFLALKYLVDNGYCCLFRIKPSLDSGCLWSQGTPFQAGGSVLRCCHLSRPFRTAVMPCAAERSNSPTICVPLTKADLATAASLCLTYEKETDAESPVCHYFWRKASQTFRDNSHWVPSKQEDQQFIL